ncbi:hypothetical protein AYR62_05885 [Secundilactobacillus paracollinoides]|uniref:Helicase Helix-turn-helix domain-containing protein n=1 Tax=Secundilactobacillus paracollinoides TaxID=240427 RepID=A0A1B2J0V9_9LACO|nr:helix-turn-helix domain-containing protein [Secundilactobacillus paracollinoides]ANZ61981.1 hypothetical protein AYR61_11895 [Secundilactobacillus paracollinoides]ANZ63668.1 hypothetical protein AYR62_05885 [Secundilactobacillus paracollinoides]ANZ67927.1 hypothetical protein AYR63_12790 [Secundilactobacillus paracollinoides]
MNATQLIQYLSPTSPRRIRVIENLLIGKRSVSTLYWGMRYDLLNWLGYQKHLTREEMETAVADTADQGLITVNDLQAALTPAGIAQQTADQSVHYQPQALDIRLSVDIPQFWQRLLLAVQVVSEYSYHNRQYYPLRADYRNQRVVKQWFSAHKADVTTTLPEALTLFLQTQPTTVADLFGQLLMGHDTPGYTLRQLTEAGTMTVAEAQLMETDAICQFAKQLMQAPNHVLRPLLAGLQQSPVSDSALATLNAFQQGQSFDQISQRRRLKPSTVREHLLEAAIFLPVTAIPYDQLLPTEIQDVFRTRLTGPIDDWQYETVRDDAIEFWQFRLYAILRSKQT